MKNKLLTALCVLGMAALLCSCEKTIGNASLVEGAWEQTTAVYDKTVYADQTGTTHLKEDGYTQTYKDKEKVWLFQENSLSLWAYGDATEWSSYLDDTGRTYRTEGEGAAMEIIVTERSIIPDYIDSPAVKRYHVEKLTNTEMVLSHTTRMFVSETNTSVDVDVTLTFKRENRLLPFIRSVYPENDL